MNVSGAVEQRPNMKEKRAAFPPFQQSNQKDYLLQTLARLGESGCKGANMFAEEKITMIISL